MNLKKWLKCGLCDYRTNAGKLIKAQARLLIHKELKHEQTGNAVDTDKLTQTVSILDTEDTAATGSPPSPCMAQPRAPALLLQVVTQDSTLYFL